MLQITYIDEAFEMPLIFYGISQAKIYMEHVQYRAMPYLGAMSDVLMYGDGYASIPPKAAYDEFIICLKQWTRAFQPLLSDARRRGGKDLIAASTLRALLIATEVATKRIYLGDKEANNPNSFVLEATEIVDLSRIVAADQGHKKVFVVDCGIVPSLFVIIMICRERSVRQAAIEVLESCGDRMEVTWNAAEIARIGRQVLEAESGAS